MASLHFLTWEQEMMELALSICIAKQSEVSKANLRDELICFGLVISLKSSLFLTEKYQELISCSSKIYEGQFSLT